MLHVLGLTAALIISFAAILVRLADVSASSAAFLRAAYALPVLAALYWATRHADTRSRRSRALSFLAGALMGASFTLWNHAIGYVGAGMATVVNNTQVFFMALASWLVLHERPPRMALVAAPIAFAGVVLVTGFGRPDAYGSQPVLGVTYALINAVVYTTFLLAFRRAAAGLRWPTGVLLDASLAAAVAALVLGLATDPSFDPTPGWPALGWLLLLALGPQVIGWSLIVAVLPRLPALTTSVMLLLQPVMTVLWGRLWFDELFSDLQWAGVLLVLCGIGVATIGSALVRSRAAAAVAPATPPGAGDLAPANRTSS